MSFRENVGFDEIYLCHNNNMLSKMQVFLKEDRQFTEKDIMKNITFHQLGDSVPALASIIYSSQDKSPSYEIGFLPTSDKDVYLMDNKKVRMICSALECELSFIDDLSTDEEVHLQELVKEVKKLIKGHQSGPNKLSGKTYDLIFSSINNWSMSASDKICLLYHRYDGLISSISATSDYVKIEWKI